MKLSAKWVGAGSINPGVNISCLSGLPCRISCRREGGMRMQRRTAHGMAEKLSALVGGCRLSTAGGRGACTCSPGQRMAGNSQHRGREMGMCMQRKLLFRLTSANPAGGRRVCACSAGQRMAWQGSVSTVGGSGCNKAQEQCTSYMYILQPRRRSPSWPKLYSKRLHSRPAHGTHVG